MQIKVEKLMLAKDSLNKLLSQELPVTTAFRLSKLAKQVIEELKTVEDNRIKLIKKYQEEPKEGEKESNIRVAPENAAAFNQDFSELLNIEIGLDFEPISIGEISDVKLTAIDLINLDVFVKN